MAIIELQERTPEWYAHRNAYVNGSEIASLWGVQPDYAPSAFSLWQVKSGKIQERMVEGERLEWGIRLEPAVAAGIADDEGWSIYKGKTGGLRAIDDKTPGMAASLDYMVADAGPAEWEKGMTGPGILQVKVIDRLRFREEWVGTEPPIYTLLQLQHEIACAGVTWGAVGCLIGGNTAKVYRYKARARIIDGIRNRVEDFWASVKKGDPPIIDHTDATTEAIRQLYPETTGNPYVPVRMDDNKELAEVAFGFITASADRQEAQRREDEYRNRLAAIVGPNRHVRCGAFTIDMSVTPAKPPRRPRPGELLKARSEQRRFTVKEFTPK